MTLYFYSADNGRMRVKTAEARETKSCYMSDNGGFPNYLRRMPKDYIGGISDGCIVLTERDDEAAREQFRAWYEMELRRAHEAIRSAETKLANLALPIEE